MKSLFQDVKERLRFHVKKVQTHPFVVDNISRGRAHLLVLGTRLKNAVPTKQQARDFWKEHHHRMVYIATFFVVCAVTIHIRASADVSSVNLYSKTCTGGWENSQNAAGAPDVEIGGINFSAENSAHAVGNPSTMTCAGFSGDVPNGVIPKKFTVKISWTATADAIVSVAPDATTESSSTNLVQDDVENALPLPSIDSSDTAVSATTTDISASSTVASSTDMGNIATSSEETTATSDTTETPVGLEAGTPSQVTTPAPSDLPQQDFLEVKYTLDGTNWKTLGTINAANAKNISFEINDADMTKWTDLSNFQISLSTLLPDSQLPNIYVDSVYLEADYETIPQIIDPPKIILKDSTAVLDGKSDFSSDEDPTFTVTDPGLTTSDVQTLVDNNQAQVVEDVRGLIDVSGQSQTTTSTSDSFGVQKNIIDPVINTVQQSVQSTSGAVTSFLAPAVAEAANNSATIDQAQVLDSFGNVTDIPVLRLTASTNSKYLLQNRSAHLLRENIHSKSYSKLRKRILFRSKILRGEYLRLTPTNRSTLRAIWHFCKWV